MWELKTFRKKTGLWRNIKLLPDFEKEKMPHGLGYTTKIVQNKIAEFRQF